MKIEKDILNVTVKEPILSAPIHIYHCYVTFDEILSSLHEGE